MNLSAFWRKIVPLQSLICGLVCQLLFSFLYMLIYVLKFKANKLLLPLHLSIILGCSALVTALSGIPLLSAKFRAWRFARFFLAALPAVAFIVLVFLYLADFVSNAFWRNTVNYKLVLDYSFQLGSVINELPIRAFWVYVFLFLILLFSLSIYLVIAKFIVKSLEEIFLPDKPYSLFKNGYRARRSAIFLA